MKSTPRNTTLARLANDKNISFHSATYDITYKGINYECKFRNSFNKCFNCQISVGGIQVKHFQTYSTPTVDKALELIQEYIRTK
jgi:hypothetical protein